MTEWSVAAAAEAEGIATAALSCPAVAALHSGPFAALVTLLPGRRIDGVRSDADRIAIGVVAAFGTPLVLLADQVRAAVAPLAHGRGIDVHVADLQLPEEQQPALTAGPTR